MYERSAIVLERYFGNILGYFSENNLKVNFQNYCSLVEKLDKFQECYEQEQTAIQEFDDVTDRLKAIQKNQEKLYKKSAKLEYSRNILFNNIEDKVEDIEKCLLKIENDIDKNGEHFKTLRADFVATLNEYNQKESTLVKSKKAKKESEKSYIKILEEAQENIDNINEFVLEFARNFNGKEIREKLLKLMIDNGKEEKIPFDEDVINLAVDLGIDIAQKEAQCYIEAYDSILKLFDEIDEDDVKIEKFKRKVRNIKAMLNFLFAQKEYLIQFLDYERMTSVNGKRIHKKLMIQACENFKLDIKQINNLYELILKEVANKSTQKIYKELYNKSYLLEIDREEESLRKEKNKVNSSIATVLGSNYWRIEGIKNIYTVFYKEVSEVFGRYLDEFDVPIDEELEIELNEEVENLKASLKVPEKAKVIEEIDENELPQLMSEDEIDTEIFDVPLITLEEIENDEVEIVEPVEETIVENLQVIEELEEAKVVEMIEETKPKRRRKDIIKEEEEKKKEKTKLKDKAKEKKVKVQIIENEEEKTEEKVELIEEIKPQRRKDVVKEAEEAKPKRRRKDIIKEEEEKKKEKAKVKEVAKKKKAEVQIIEQVEEIDEPKIEEQYIEEDALEEKIQNIQDIELHTSLEEGTYESEEEEESLFGNIKNVKGTKRTNIDLEMLEQLGEKNKSNKKGIFSSLMNMNSKKGKRVAD